MSSGKKFCWSCGSSLLAKDLFCRQCRAGLKKDEPAAHNPQTESKSAGGEKSKTKVDSKPTDPDSATTPVGSPQTSVAFPKAVRLGFQHYSDFSGRATRSEFWWWWLFTGLAFPLFLITSIPMLAVTVRRLRDANQSLWWIVVAPIPILGIMVMILCALESAVITPNLNSGTKHQTLPGNKVIETVEVRKFESSPALPYSFTVKQGEDSRKAKAKKSANRPKSTLDDINQAFKENDNVVSNVEKATDSIQSKII